MAIEAVPTIYGGVRMRSRLEARWAAFFDLCGWTWKYEPRTLPGWVPDFELTTPAEDFPVLVEVKPICWIGEPCVDWAHELDHPKIQKIHDHNETVLVLGAYPAGEWNGSYGFPGLGMWQTPGKGRFPAELMIKGGKYGLPVLPYHSGLKTPPAGTLSKLWVETLARTRSQDSGEAIVERMVNYRIIGVSAGGRCSEQVD